MTNIGGGDTTTLEASASSMSEVSDNSTGLEIGYFSGETIYRNRIDPSKLERIKMVDPSLGHQEFLPNALPKLESF